MDMDMCPGIRVPVIRDGPKTKKRCWGQGETASLNGSEIYRDTETWRRKKKKNQKKKKKRLKDRASYPPALRYL